jgi:hypothetical protein
MDERPPKPGLQINIRDHMDNRPPKPSLMTYIIVLIVVAIVVIVILALLGPAMGTIQTGSLRNLQLHRKLFHTGGGTQHRNEKAGWVGEVAALR